MYEDLNQIATLKFNKEREAVSKLTRDSVRNAQSEYAAKAGGYAGRNGQHDANIGHIQINGAKQICRAIYDIWIGLIKKRNGSVNRRDIGFIVGKVQDLARIQKGHLHQAFVSQRMGAVVNLLIQEAEVELSALTSSLRRDLEIMVREDEAFPNKLTEKKEISMASTTKKRLSAGRRVLVGNRSRPRTVISVSDQPRQMGEFIHHVRLDEDEQTLDVAGCDLQPYPQLDEDLQHALPAVHLHIENSQIANLNLGSQVGTINSAIELISRQGVPERDVAEALRHFTEATVSDLSLPDSDKHEIVQALSTVAEQSAKKPGDRSTGTLKAVITWLPTAISAASNLASLWEKTEPIIKGYLGL